MGHTKKGSKSVSHRHGKGKSQHQINREMRRIAHARERQSMISATNGGRTYVHRNHHLQ